MPFKGTFKPKNPEKYLGDPYNIVYRSSWEQVMMRYCDQNAKVIRWASEEFSIPYRSPLDGQIHRYFPDFWLVVEKRDGNRETLVIEVKPKSQCMEPKRGKKRTSTFLHEVATYGVNDAKWKAATAFCEDRRWKFIIFTEDELAIMYSK